MIRAISGIEDERTHSRRHFPRNYGTIFGALGMVEVEQIANPPDLPGGFVARVFRKPDHTHPPQDSDPASLQTEPLPPER